MGGKIFLIAENEELIEMNEQPYDLEARLQDLLANYPDLLAGDQMNIESPRRFLLITPEASVPASEEDSGTWSLDHLFVDQDGIPTLVEVKRSSDTRIRREVVGQMLDYAANGVVYWPIEEIRARWQTRAGSSADELAEFLDVEDGEEEFWQKVETNLKAGVVRLVFVADQIPPTLRRVVEFLAEQMTPAEVVAVEVKQFLGENGMQTLVPRVVAQRSSRTGPVRPSRSWDEDSFFKELTRNHPEMEAPARKLMEWANASGLDIRWGKGSQYGTFSPVVSHKSGNTGICSVWTSGYVQMSFGPLSYTPPFDSEGQRLQFLTRINGAISGEMPADSAAKYPSFLLSEVSDLEGLLAAFDWAVTQVRSAA